MNILHHTLLASADQATAAGERAVLSGLGCLARGIAATGERRWRASVACLVDGSAALGAGVAAHAVGRLTRAVFAPRRS